jgi:hypothetical protein
MPHSIFHNTQRLAVWWSVGHTPMCRLAHFPRPWRSRCGAGRHRGEEPDHPGASSWSSACKDNIGTPVLRCSKAASKKRLRCHRGFGELPPFTHGLSLSKLLGGYLLVARARSHPHWRSSVPLGSLVETAPIIPPACLKPGEACNTFALGVESVRCEAKSQKSLPCQASLEIGYCSDTDVARLCHYRSAEMWY